MKPAKIYFKKTLGLFEARHDEIARRANRFQEVLTNLNYEGKPRLGKNLKEARALLNGLKKSLSAQFAVEEKAIFPFLGKHIPKLNCALDLLQAEHEELKTQLEIFENRLDVFPKRQKGSQERLKAAPRIKESGTYLVYCLRNHLRAEKGLIFKCLGRELKKEEKRKLARLITEVFERHSDLTGTFAYEKKTGQGNHRKAA